MKKPHLEDFIANQNIINIRTIIPILSILLFLAGSCFMLIFIYLMWDDGVDRFVYIANKYNYPFHSFGKNNPNVYYWLNFIFNVVLVVLFFCAIRECKDTIVKIIQKEALKKYELAMQKYERYLNEADEQHDRETARIIRRKRALNEIDNEDAIRAYSQLSMMQDAQNEKLYKLVQATIQSAERREIRNLDSGLNEIERLISSGERKSGR